MFKNSAVQFEILHVYHPNPSARRFEAKTKNYQAELLHILEEWVKETLEELPTKIKYFAVMGTPTEQIVALSKRSHLIMMSGKHYKSALFRTVDSRSAGIVLGANCPILIVPMGASFNGIKNTLIIERNQEDIRLAKTLLHQFELDNANQHLLELSALLPQQVQSGGFIKKDTFRPLKKVLLKRS